MNQTLIEHWTNVIAPTYPVPQLALIRGQGSTVYDADGNSYVDMFAGVAVNALGQAHPAVVAAITQQAGTLGHISNFFVSPPVVTLAEKLLSLAGAQNSGRVFFCNSGAEANETALKASRRTGRKQIIAAEGAFHGRTAGALSLTGQAPKREPFTPLLPEVTYVPYGDTAALAEAISDKTAMVILEPILGEAGVIPAPPRYLAAARELSTQYGALLALDEVQTGIARTGTWFAFQQAGIVPDLLTLAKGLGGGLPIGACVAFGQAATLLQAGQHGTTFGGNPICCAAAIAVLETIEQQNLCNHAAVMGELFRTGINKLNNPLISGVRGAGLLQAIVLTQPVAQQVVTAFLKAGYLVNAVAADVIRIAPPLIIDQAQITGFITALDTVLTATGIYDAQYLGR